MDSNLQRLQEAGIAVTSPLAEPYASVVNELSEAEVSAIVSIKQRFDSRIEVEAHGADSARPAGEFFGFF
jgi:hypothetical protein